MDEGDTQSINYNSYRRDTVTLLTQIKHRQEHKNSVCRVFLCLKRDGSKCG